ncbi:Fungal specific transcription factor domain-containing protein [Cladophialophora immunda]|nr:Fungal specific transcription factor domain-containing protein [Cladophialophora immunda]
MASFLGAVNGTENDKISLVLFQAVMFAGVAFTDLSHLQQEGFRTYNDARKTFFDRVKLLYEMDVESNPTTMIQILLLMTYWYGQQNDTKGRFYWLRTAFSLATDIGLDRQHQFSNESARQRMRRKLWYCCLMRDKLLSITERRQNAHRGQGENLDSIDPADFEDAAFSRALHQYYRPGQGIEPTSLGQLCAQKVKLCLIIGRILDSQYELSGVRLVYSSDPFMVLIPKTKILTTEAAARDQELRGWCTETASIKEAALGQHHGQNGSLLGLHSATIELLYLTALCTVHRPLLLHEQSKGSAAEALQGFSRQTLRSAARRISEIARQLEESHLLEVMPPLAVGALIVASIQHLKDALSTEPELRGTGNLYLRQTIQAFAALSPKYNSADCAIGFIERVRSGKLPYRTFEWEDRANPRPSYDECTLMSTSGESNAIAIAGTDMDSTASPFVTQSTNARLQNDNRYHAADMFGSSFASEEDFNIPYFRSSNLDAISELLLSAPFDANNIDWANRDWRYAGSTGT